MTREAILGQLSAERDAQDAKWGGPAHDDGHGPDAWVALLARHLGLAVNDGGAGYDPARYRRQLVRVAATAVAALEAFDRTTGVRAEKVAGTFTAGSGW